MNKDVIFTFDNHVERIVVSLKHMSAEDFCCWIVPILVMVGRKNIFLVEDDLRENMLIFLELLQRAIINELPLHSSINQDVGYLFNQYMYHRGQEKNFSDESVIVYDSCDVWVGKVSQLWGNGNQTSWIYNDNNEQVVFEVTPVYYGDFSSDDFNDQEFYEWMSKYKPIFVQKISKKTLQKWIKIADQLLRDIDQISSKVFE